MYQEKLRERIQTKINEGRWSAETTLDHFALINYTLPVERLRPHIPDRFDIPVLEVDGEPRAFVSAVPFIDRDFQFPNISPSPRYRFGQINYRAYIVDKTTGEDVVWFFGTVLGSYWYNLPRRLWKMPWHRGEFVTEFKRNQTGNYQTYKIHIHSSWGKARIELQDTAEAVTIAEGFESVSHMKLFLTHPIEGFYYRTNGKLGTYRVWHPEMMLTNGKAEYLYFQPFEDLGLLSANEMRYPHSIFICPEILFKVELPPREV